MYKTHLCLISTFLNNLQTIIQESCEHCPIIIMGDFNVDILKDNNQSKKKKKKKKQELLRFMDKFQLKSQFNENTTKVGSQLNCIWANVPGNECKFRVLKAYWLDFHKFFYIAFKLPNTLLMYNKKPLFSPFILSVTFVKICM